MSALSFVNERAFLLQLTISTFLENRKFIWVMVSKIIKFLLLPRLHTCFAYGLLNVSTQLDIRVLSQNFNIVLSVGLYETSVHCRLIHYDRKIIKKYYIIFLVKFFSQNCDTLFCNIFTKNSPFFFILICDTIGTSARVSR